MDPVTRHFSGLRRAGVSEPRVSGRSVQDLFVEAKQARGALSDESGHLHALLKLGKALPSLPYPLDHGVVQSCHKLAVAA